MTTLYVIGTPIGNLEDITMGAGDINKIGEKLFGLSWIGYLEKV